MKKVLLSIIPTLFIATLLICSSQEKEKEALILPTTAKAQKVISAARDQVDVTTIYDPAYVELKYPNGDIPMERGVCTDVVIRALRTAHQYDLQKQVHLDMKANFRKYPKIWKLTRTDKNIDHRRVPNLQTFFKRKGWSVPITKKGKDYKPGDLVTAMYPGNRPHIMIVSNKVDFEGNPKVIHNAGGGADENGMLFSFPITGHYRIKLP